MKTKYKFIFTTQSMVLMSLFVAILCILSPLSIPLGFTPVPFTFQTLIVFLIGLLLNPIEAGIVILVYLLLGIVGLPVFAGFESGFSTLTGAKGGFLIGFLISGVAISLLKGTTRNVFRYGLVCIVVGLPIIYLLGNYTVAYITGMNYLTAFTYSTLPYLIPDMMKSCIAAYFAVTLKKRLPKNEMYTV